MSWVISSVTDIRTYVCNENPGGVYGDEGSTEALVEAIRSADHPSYGTDWSEWLTVNIDALVDDALAQS